MMFDLIQFLVGNSLQLHFYDLLLVKLWINSHLELSHFNWFLIVNSETNRNIEFKMQTSPGSFSGSSVSKGSGTSLVYFEIEKSRIIEIINEETTSSINEMAQGSSSMSSLSKSTIKLISE